MSQKQPNNTLSFLPSTSPEAKEQYKTALEKGDEGVAINKYSRTTKKTMKQIILLLLLIFSNSCTFTYEANSETPEPLDCEEAFAEIVHQYHSTAKMPVIYEAGHATFLFSEDWSIIIDNHFEKIKVNDRTYTPEEYKTAQFFQGEDAFEIAADTFFIRIEDNAVFINDQRYVKE